MKLITTIGQKNCGKTTVLYLLAECIVDDTNELPLVCNSIEHIEKLKNNRIQTIENQYLSGVKYNKIAPPYEGYILIDNPSREMVEYVYDNNGTTIRIRRKSTDKYLESKDRWIESIKIDFVINSFDENLRQLSFDVKRLYEDIKKRYDNITKNPITSKSQVA
jgi:hypothetical protein